MLDQQDPDDSDRVTIWPFLLTIVGGVGAYIIGANADIVLIEALGLLLVLFAMWRLSWLLFRAVRETRGLKTNFTRRKEEDRGDDD